MRAVFSPFFSFFTSSEGEESHAPSAVFARKSCNLSASTSLKSFGFSALIDFFNAETDSASSMSTSNALPATPTIAQKSFTIFPRRGRFWNERERILGADFQPMMRRAGSELR
ncbi:hypothetical protein PC116_g30640 [Phytophthora cactorum]|nr:hypothetical protein PC116_g30640 [Phytophthora cactorum]